MNTDRRLIIELARHLQIEYQPVGAADVLELHIDKVSIQMSVAGGRLRFESRVGVLNGDEFEQTALLKRVLTNQAVFLASPLPSQQTLTIDPAARVFLLYQEVTTELLDLTALIKLLELFVASVETWQTVIESAPLPATMTF
jgi:hypothetical protein